MPDLMPDTSIFTKPTQPNIGDLVGTAGRIQEIQGRQSMTESLNEATNPESGEIDFDKAMAIRATKPGFFSASDANQLTAGKHNQLILNATRNEQMGRIWSFVAQKDNPTPEDIDRAMALSVQTLGGGNPNSPAAKNVEKYFHGVNPRNKVDLVNRVNTLASAYNLTPKIVPIPGTYPVQYTTEAELARRAETQGQGAPGGGSVSVTAPRAGMTSAGPRAVPEDETQGLGGGLKEYSPEDRKEWSAAQTRMGSYPTDVRPAEDVIQKLSKLGPRTTGPIGDLSNTLRKFGTNVGIAGAETWNKTTDFEAVRKDMEQWVGSQAERGVGQKSVEGLLHTISANPNMTLGTASNIYLMKVGLALRRMEQVGSQEFDRLYQSGQITDPGAFKTWYARWAPKQDWRAFGMDTYTQTERDRLEAEVTRDPNASRKFARSHQAGQRAGIYKPEVDWNAEGR